MQRTCSQTKFWMILFLFIFFFSVSKAQNQNDIRIMITDVRQIDHKTLGVLSSVDLVVDWSVFKVGADGMFYADRANFDRFRAVCLDSKNLERRDTVSVNQNGLCVFQNKKVARDLEYRFLIEGFSKGAKVAVSDTFRIQPGRPAKVYRTQMTPTGKSVAWYLFWLGRTPLDLVSKILSKGDYASHYDQSSSPGQFAFFALACCLYIGSIIIFFFTFRHIQIRKLFPLKSNRSVSERMRTIFGRDVYYSNSISPQFTRILNDWKNITEESEAGSKNKSETPWKEKIKSLMISLEAMDQDRRKGSLEKLKYWFSRKILNMTSGQRTYDFSIVPLLHAGMEQQILADKWSEGLQKRDKAIEDTASFYIEELKHKSLLNWLWTFATFAPLFGFFGTVTGIMQAFQGLESNWMKIAAKGDTTRFISKGIYEALVTTIVGLAIGVIMYFAYYYFEHKINWVYAKWENIYLDLSQKKHFSKKA